MKNGITNGFDRLTPANLVAKARFIIAEMTANAEYFPTPDPALADVKAAVDTFEVAAQAAENRDRVAIAYRNELKDGLVSLLRQLGSYVNLKANGNRTIALSSGFDVAKDATPTPAITFVEAPMLLAGVNAGELEARSKQVIGARTYQYYLNDDAHLPISQWQLFPSTRTRHSFSGLASGKRYYVKVGVVGTNNQIVYSEASSYIPQ